AIRWRRERDGISSARGVPQYRPPSSALLAGLLLSGRRNVFRAVALEDLLRTGLLLAVVGVDGDKHVPTFHLRLVHLRLVLGDAEPDEGAGDSTRRGPRRSAAQSGHD